MPVIPPEIERICRKSGQPVFITKNGENDLVVLSAAAYERDRARLEIYELLAAAENDVRKGARGVSPKTLAAVLRKARG
jgi:prevent-host-death family protein